MADQPPPQFAQYPRPQLGGFGSGEFSRPPGVYVEALGDAWKIVTQDLGTWVLISLVGTLLLIVLSVPSFIISSLIQNGGSLMPTAEPSLGASALGTLVSTVLGALAYPATAGFMWAGLRRVRGETPTIADLMKGFEHFFPLVLYGLIYSVLTVVGFMLCIVPAIYVVGAFSLAPLLIIDKGMSPIDALQTSRQLLGGSAWMMFVFLLLAGILSGLGVIACCVGVLITIPMYFVGIALHYHYYMDTTPVEYAAPNPVP